MLALNDFILEALSWLFNLFQQRLKHNITTANFLGLYLKILVIFLNGNFHLLFLLPLQLF